jgi:photosystem II stability/assembly factor-like uncharacterized protein
MKHTLHTRAVRFLPELFCFFSILIFVFILTSGSPAQTGWYQQPLPVSGTIYDMQFIDANTGWITLYNPASLVKTTDGGNNWLVITAVARQFEAIEFVNDSVGYSTGSVGASDQLLKTTNGGLNWTTIYDGINSYNDLSFTSNDTGYLCGYDGAGGIWKTTDGGLNVSRLYITGLAPLKIFFLKKPYDGEYYGWWLGNGYMGKTTNSGVNWSKPTRTINGQNGYFNYIHFRTKDSGWVVFTTSIGNQTGIYFTRDNCSSWVLQYTDSSSSVLVPTMIESTGQEKVYTGDFFWNKIHVTTNSGLTWGTQQSAIFYPTIIDIIDSMNAVSGLYSLTRTADGGGVITYIGSDPSNTATPGTFALNQNYPNPFNSQTVITFSIPVSCRVSLNVCDMLGKEVIGLYEDEALSAGNYRAALDFGKGSLPSGTYFLGLRVKDNTGNELFSKNRRMMYLK